MLSKMSGDQCLELYQAIQAQPATEEVATALSEIFEALARPDRHVPLARLMSVSDRTFIRERFYDGSDIASAREKSKPEETARWLADQGSLFLRTDQAAEMIGYSIYLWGEKDSRAASEFAVQVPLAAFTPPGWDPNTHLYWYLRKVTFLRSRLNLSTTLAWAVALPNTDRRRVSAILGVLDRMAATDAERAKDFVRKQPSSEKDAPELADQLVVDLANPSKADVDMGGIGGWTLSLLGPAVRRAALTSLVDVWLNKMDVNWKKFDELPQVVLWATSVPADKARAEVWSTVSTIWGPMLPFAAKGWLRGLPEGADRDAATAAYDEAVIGKARKMIARRNYGQALHWLPLAILDQKRGADLVQTLFLEWAQNDPRSAREWAIGHGMQMPTAAPSGQ